MHKNKINLFKGRHVLASTKEKKICFFIFKLEKSFFLSYPPSLPCLTYLQREKKKKNQSGWSHLGDCFTAFTSEQKPTVFSRAKLVNKARPPQGHAILSSLPSHMKI